MKRRSSIHISLVILVILLSALDCPAAWIENGVLVCGEAGRQFRQEMVADGRGGAVIAWTDERTGSKDIYAQRIDRFGLPLWQTGGVPLCAAPSVPSYMQIVPDASGGAIGAWYDDRSGAGGLYLQRIDGSGIAQWAPDGTLISAYARQWYPAMVPDGSGGAIVSWCDVRDGSYYVIAQRIDENGTLLWGSEGIVVTTGLYAPALVADGSGGAIVGAGSRAWRVDAEGSFLWSAEGVSAPGGDIFADGNGGAFFVVLTILPQVDPLPIGGGFNCSIAVERIDSNGNIAWPDSVVIADSTATWYEFPPTPGLVPDGCGGAIIVWYGEVSGSLGVRGQRIDSLGTKLWSDSGALIGSVVDLWGPQIVSDGAHGAVVISGSMSIYAQRIDQNGLAQWSTDGIVLCNGTAATWPLHASVVSDGSGGGIAAWTDKRGATLDIYAARVDASGTEPLTDADAPPPISRLRQNYPNPFNPLTTISFDLETESRAELGVYDASGRMIAVLLDRRLAAGRHTVTWNGADRSGRKVASGVYFCRLTVGDRSESIAMVIAR